MSTGTGKATDQLRPGAARQGARLCRRGCRRHAAAARAAQAAAGGEQMLTRLRDDRAAAGPGAGAHGDRPASRSTRAELGASSAGFRRSAWPTLEQRDPRARRPAIQRRLAQAAGRNPVRRDEAAGGGKKARPAPRRPDAAVLEELAAQGHRRCRRGRARLAPARQAQSTYADALAAQIDPRDRPRPYLLSPWPRPPPGGWSSTEPNLQNIPIRTEEGRRSASAFVAEPGHVLLSRRLLADRAAAAGAHGRCAGAEGSLRARRRHPRHAPRAEIFGVPLDAAWTRGAAARQGDQFRHHLRHLSAFGLAEQLGIGQGEARGYHRRLFRPATPASATTWSARRRCARSMAMSRPSSAGKLLHPRHQRQDTAARAVRRTRRHQRADPGRRGRHHQARHDPRAGRRCATAGLNGPHAAAGA